MTGFDTFRDLLEFDLWANLQWIEVAERLGAVDQMLHIVGAQEVWLSRCQGRPKAELDDPTIAQMLERVNAGWKNYLANADLSSMITYRNDAGIEYTNSLSDILRHMINHATYHRGELRGLCRERNIDEFPETDFILYARLMH